MNKISFEEAMKKLEEIVKEMETGNLSLEEAIAKFKEGIELSAYCNKKLDEAERKITMLIEENNGDLKEKPFKLDEED